MAGKPDWAQMCDELRALREELARVRAEQACELTTGAAAGQPATQVTSFTIPAGSN